MRKVSEEKSDNNSSKCIAFNLNSNFSAEDGHLPVVLRDLDEAYGIFLKNEEEASK